VREGGKGGREVGGRWVRMWESILWFGSDH